MSLISSTLKYLLFFSLLITSACFNNTDNSKLPKETVLKDEPLEEESDCIFDNDYYGLTAEWLKDLGIQEYIWNDVLKKAIIISKGDSVFLSKGGCDSFSFDLAIKIQDDKHELSDSAYWVGRALNIATKFGMPAYVNSINKGEFWVSYRFEKELWFEVVDDDLEDNLYYSGIAIIQEADYWWVKISKYYN